MAILASVLFVMTLAIALGVIFATVAPRWSYIVALVSGSSAALVLQPVASRRRVRRINPLTVRSEVGPLRAVA